MASPRRIGSRNSETRSLLIDVATEVLKTQGRGSVTVRRLAEATGLSRQIVHYYFGSMEELYLAIVDRASNRLLERQAKLHDACNPLRAMWELVFDADGINLENEFLGLANQFASVREMLEERTKRYQENQAGFVKRASDRFGRSLFGLDPESVPVVLRGIARTIVVERGLGITRGHLETLDQIECQLATFDTAGEGKRG